MKLSEKEFDAMQTGWRKRYIRKVELATFRKFGLAVGNRDILEVGCGNGYAASLITAEGPRSYTGLDIMPEQLAIARERGLANARFVEGSADDLSAFPAGSFDAVLDFCILHHVEGWRRVPPGPEGRRGYLYRRSLENMHPYRGPSVSLGTCGGRPVHLPRAGR